MLNPYSSTHSRNPDYTSQPDDQSGPTLSQLLQTTWIATGVSFLALTIVSAVTLDRSITHLTLSDDSYAAAFAASLPVTTFFAVGSLVGWWFQSTRIAKIATFVPFFPHKCPALSPIFPARRR